MTNLWQEVLSVTTVTTEEWIYSRESPLGCANLMVDGVGNAPGVVIIRFYQHSWPDLRSSEIYFSQSSFTIMAYFVNWTDINVAFGKPVKYSGVMETTTETLTDGLSDSNDPVKTAQCPVLAKVNPYFEIDLLDGYPIHFVAIYGKDGEL